MYPRLTVEVQSVNGDFAVAPGTLFLADTRCNKSTSYKVLYSSIIVVVLHAVPSFDGVHRSMYMAQSVNGSHGHGGMGPSSPNPWSP